MLSAVVDPFPTAPFLLYAQEEEPPKELYVVIVGAVLFDTAKLTLVSKFPPLSLEPERSCAPL